MNIKRICVFGDSIAWGACDYERGGWVERLKVYFLENADIVVYNFGVSGNTTSDLLNRFDSEIRIMDPEVIVFAIGINDTKYLKDPNFPVTNINQFENNILTLINKARKLTDKIVFVGLTPVDELKTKPRIHDGTEKNYDNEIIEKYNSLLSELCKREEVQFINVFSSFGEMDLEDGLHPNSNGHKVVFEKVKSVIENLDK